ncbi:MAG TPA: ABC transporter substrate-binding protein [Acidimicrobiales bacterium]|jgi:osmoprotectant transport system substrate-binding protein
MTRRFRLLVALLAVLALLGAACGGDNDDSEVGGEEGSSTSAAGDDEGGAPPEGPAITIGAQDFGESAILAEIYSQVLSDAGYEVDIQDLGGFRDIELSAFEGGDINMAVEYAASMLEFLNENAGEATGDAQETVGLLQERLDGMDLVAFEPAEAIDTNGFVVTQETSEGEGLTTLSDLQDHEDLVLGGPQDCETNPFCIPGLERVYDVDLSGSFQGLEAGLVPEALEAGEIDVGVIFSTNGIIADKGWVLLEDDQQMLAADNITPVVTTEVADAYGADLEELVNSVSAELTTEDLTELNRRFDIDKEEAADIASDWISEHLGD